MNVSHLRVASHLGNPTYRIWKLSGYVSQNKTVPPDWLSYKNITFFWYSCITCMLSERVLIFISWSFNYHISVYFPYILKLSGLIIFILGLHQDWNSDSLSERDHLATLHYFKFNFVSKNLLKNFEREWYWELKKSMDCKTIFIHYKSRVTILKAIKLCKENTISWFFSILEKVC